MSNKKFYSKSIGIYSYVLKNRAKTFERKRLIIKYFKIFMIL
jgi:hypothetical protein